MEYSGELPSCIYIALVVLADNTIKSNQVTSLTQFFQHPPTPLGLAKRRNVNWACLWSSNARAGGRALSAVTTPTGIVRLTPRDALPTLLVRT